MKVGAPEQVSGVVRKQFGDIAGIEIVAELRQSICRRTLDAVQLAGNEGTAVSVMPRDLDVSFQ